MQYRSNPLLSAVFASSLAASMVLGTSWTASAAVECIQKPSQQVGQAGHWYYHVDRVHHRKCWFFEAAEVKISPPSSPGPALAANPDSQSWFTWFAAGLTQAFSPESQQNSTAVGPSNATQPALVKTASTRVAPTRVTSAKRPKINKIATRERSRIVQLSQTISAASTERYDQSLPLSKPEMTAKRPAQLTAADREALFRDFLKWYSDERIFGPP